MTEPGEDPAAVPEDPRQAPEQTVDALEERIDGPTPAQQRDEPEHGPPAFEQDIDPEDVTAEQGGHTDSEPPP